LSPKKKTGVRTLKKHWNQKESTARLRCQEKPTPYTGGKKASLRETEIKILISQKGYEDQKVAKSESRTAPGHRTGRARRGGSKTEREVYYFERKI